MSSGDPTWTAVSGREAACAVIRVLYETQQQKVLPRLELATPPTDGQLDAAQSVRRALFAHGFALLADGVGTGKSIIALQIINEAVLDERSVLVAVPAALLPTWRRLLGPATARIGLVSHTRLARVVSASPVRPDLVVVDEAHAFRNPATRRYRALARLTAQADTLLLTATPINNSLLDLYFLLHLRVRDGDLATYGVPDLRRVFEARSARTRRSSGTSDPLGADALPPAVRVALDQIVIRRTREDAIRDLPAGLRFPSRDPPVAVRYPVPGGHFGHALRLLSDLEFTAFAPAAIGLPGELLRLMLLKRLESGVPAFAASLGRLRDFNVASVAAFACGRFLRPKGRTTAAGDAAQLEFVEVVGEPLPTGLDGHDLARAAYRDLARIDALRRITDELSRVDGKLSVLKALLEGPLAGRSVLVFTEFRETAAALWKSLRGYGGVARIDGGGAWLGAVRAGRQEVVRRFAPRSNGASPPPASEAIRWLIATDVLSEGLNLQDAEAVISYDLPWNPVRLIQRVGRIDRLGSPHTRIRVYNFMPDRSLDEITRLLDRIRSKLRAMRVGLGHTDAAPLSEADLEFLSGRGDIGADLHRPPGVVSRPSLRQLTENMENRGSDNALERVGRPVADLRTRPGGSVVLVFEAPAGVLARRVGGGDPTLSELELVGLLERASASLGLDRTAVPGRRLTRALRTCRTGSSGLGKGSGTDPLSARAIARVTRLLTAFPDPRGTLRRAADDLVRRLGDGLSAGEEAEVREWLTLCRSVALREPARVGGADRRTTSAPGWHMAECLFRDLAGRLGPARSDRHPEPRLIAAFLIDACD